MYLISAMQNHSTHMSNIDDCVWLHFPPHINVAIFPALLQGVMGVGIFYIVGRLMGNTNVTRSSILLSGAVLVAHRISILQAIWRMFPALTYFYVIATFLAQLGAATVLLGPKPKRQSDHGSSDHSFLRPMIFPCRTTHSRLFPIKHSFSYSYLLAGVPVDWEGCSGGLLSAGPLQKPSWFSIRAGDYLGRGRCQHSLSGKLKDYLASQGVLEGRFAHAYLITAPRFLGFSFNPVSFWYLYDHDRTLSAMILEVNNTFDERRMYLMEQKLDASAPTNAKGFVNSWPKDFHVSPFNDRDGSYSLTAKDPAVIAPAIYIDNNIVLRDDEGKAKIVARVFSTESGLDPSQISPGAKILFVWRWWWVGFLTNPRILREARILWKKKLQVYYRPEVFQTSIGRKESSEETILEALFRAYLNELVAMHEVRVIINYQPAAGVDRGTIVRVQGVNGSSSCETLDLHVLTPAFYLELVRAKTVKEVFARFCFAAAKGEAMVHASNHALWQQLLNEDMARRLHEFPEKPPRLWGQRVVSLLRGEPIRGLLAVCPNIVRGKRVHSRLSDFDEIVRHQQPESAYMLYLRTARKLLLADRIAFGFSSLLELYRSLLVLLLLVHMARTVVSPWSAQARPERLLSLLISAVSFHGVNTFLTV